MKHKKTNCIICKSKKTITERFTRSKTGLTFNFTSCENCGFVYNPENTHIYQSQSFTEGSVPGINKRVGDGITPGREYRMAETAINILNSKKTKNILIFGAGISRDHLLLSEKFPNKNTFITDTSNFQNVENYIEINSRKRFDIIIASEVIEHFTDPAKDFKYIFSKLGKNSIVIASTNMKDDTCLTSLDYPFCRGHVSYYSGKSLINIAKKYNCKVDFRLPLISQDKKIGPRKRYVLFYKSNQTEELILEYFSKNCFALSE